MMIGRFLLFGKACALQSIYQKQGWSASPGGVRLPAITVNQEPLSNTFFDLAYNGDQQGLAGFLNANPNWNLNIQDANSGLTALMIATQYSHEENFNHADCVNLLLQRGADPKIKNIHGWTALHYSAEGNGFATYHKIAELLLQFNASITPKTNFQTANKTHKWTPFHIAQGVAFAAAHEISKEKRAKRAKDKRGKRQALRSLDWDDAKKEAERVTSKEDIDINIATLLRPKSGNLDERNPNIDDVTNFYLKEGNCGLKYVPSGSLVVSNKRKRSEDDEGDVSPVSASGDDDAAAPEAADVMKVDASSLALVPSDPLDRLVHEHQQNYEKTLSALQAILPEVRRQEASLLRLQTELGLEKEGRASDLSTVQEQLQSVRSEMESCKQTHKCELDDIKSTLAQTQESLNKAKKQKTADDQQISRLDTKNTEQAQEILNLNSKNSEQAQQISSLDTKNTEQTEEISSLNTKNADHVQEISSLKTTVQKATVANEIKTSCNVCMTPINFSSEPNQPNTKDPSIIWPCGCLTSCFDCATKLQTQNMDCRSCSRSVEKVVPAAFPWTKRVGTSFLQVQGRIELFKTAIEKSDLAGVTRLLEEDSKLAVEQIAKSDPKVRNNDVSALMLACKQPSSELARVLLYSPVVDHEVEFSKTDSNGMDVFMYACKYRHVDVARWMLDNNHVKDINRQSNFGCTAFFHATKLRYNKESLNPTIPLLVERGANVNIVETKSHKTALEWAILHRTQHVVHYLLQNGGQLIFEGETRSDAKNSRIMKSVAEAKKHPNAHELAAEVERSQRLLFMCQFHEQNNCQKDQSSIEAGTGYGAIISALLEPTMIGGVDQHNRTVEDYLKADQWRILRAAMSNQNVPAVRLLVDIGGDIFIKTIKSDITPLIFAAKNNETDLFDRILSLVPKEDPKFCEYLTARDSDNKSAITYAVANENNAIQKAYKEAKKQCIPPIPPRAAFKSQPPIARRPAPPPLDMTSEELQKKTAREDFFNAIYDGDLDKVVAILRDQGNFLERNMTLQGFTPLMVAVQRLRILPDPDEEEKDGDEVQYSVEELLTDHKLVEIVKILLDPRSDREGGHWRAPQSWQTSVTPEQQILFQGPDGWTALHYAAQHNRDDILHDFLSLQLPDIDPKTDFMWKGEHMRWTPWAVAFGCRNRNAWELLEESGSQDKTKWNKTPQSEQVYKFLQNAEGTFSPFYQRSGHFDENTATREGYETPDTVPMESSHCDKCLSDRSRLTPGTKVRVSSQSRAAPNREGTVVQLSSKKTRGNPPCDMYVVQFDESCTCMRYRYFEKPCTREESPCKHFIHHKYLENIDGDDEDDRPLPVSPGQHKAQMRRRHFSMQLDDDRTQMETEQQPIASLAEDGEEPMKIDQPSLPEGSATNKRKISGQLEDIINAHKANDLEPLKQQVRIESNKRQTLERDHAELLATLEAKHAAQLQARAQELQADFTRRFEEFKSLKEQELTEIKAANERQLQHLRGINEATESKRLTEQAQVKKQQTQIATLKSKNCVQCLENPRVVTDQHNIETSVTMSPCGCNTFCEGCAKRIMHLTEGRYLTQGNREPYYDCISCKQKGIITKINGYHQTRKQIL